MNNTKSMSIPDTPIYCENPKTWSRIIEEQVWLEELYTAVRPFVQVADQIPLHAILDGLWPGYGLTVENWLTLRKYATGAANYMRRQ